MRLLLVSLCFLLGTSWAEEPPKDMLKLEVVFQSPDVPAGSFAAKPKVMYRAATRYCRTEEAADPENGIHGLVVVNEPDYWMVNLTNKSGKHGVDPGPSYNCHMPIFAETTGFELEFGRELEYFKSKGIAAQNGPTLQGKETNTYKLEVGDASIALFTYGKPERPLAVARVRGDKNEIYWYSGYGELQFDPKLFDKPSEVKIEDSKPQAAHQPQ